jgi:hypothetical protein
MDCLDTGVRSKFPTAGNIVAAINLIRPYLGEDQYGSFWVDTVSVTGELYYSFAIPFDFSLYTCTESRMANDWQHLINGDTPYQLRVTVRIDSWYEIVVIAWQSDSTELDALWFAHTQL